MTHRVKPGENLQRLVRIIEMAISSNPGMSIQSPARLRDKDTGFLREHDVVITIREKHHEVRLALECRDRSRKVGVPEVEAFSSKCDRTGIDQGIIVSTKGFTSTAKIKAQASNIRCLTLEQAARFQWIAMDSLSQLQRTIVGTNLIVILADGATPDVAMSKVHFGDGNEITAEHASRLAARALDEMRPLGPAVQYSEDVESASFALDIDLNNPPYLVDSGGEIHVVSGGRLDVRYKMIVTQSQLDFHTYSDASQALGITEAATASLLIGDKRVHFVAFTNEDGTKSIKLVVDPEGG